MKPQVVVIIASLLCVLCLGAYFHFQAEKSTWTQPVPVPCSSLQEAELLAVAEAQRVGGIVISASGKSNLPTYPEHIIAVIVPTPYPKLKAGQFAYYQSRWHLQSRTLHRLAAKDAHGWIGSGDGNSRSESWDRIDESNYFGTLAAVFTFPQ